MCIGFFFSKDLVPFENCKIQFVNEVFKIEEPGTQLNINDANGSVVSPEKRMYFSSRLSSVLSDICLVNTLLTLTEHRN